MIPDGFLQAILAAPDDDAPRLVLADWLDEHGDADRAEFIRVQCALAKWDSPVPTKDVIEAGGKRWEFKPTAMLRRRERDLWSRNADAAMQANESLWGVPWRFSGWSPNQLHVKTPEMRLAFRRGFVEVVTLTAETWLEHGDAILAAAPIREVALTTLPKMACRVGVGSFPWAYHLVGRPKRRYYPTDERLSAREAALALLRANWPTVRTWNLPP